MHSYVVVIVTYLRPNLHKVSTSECRGLFDSFVFFCFPLTSFPAPGGGGARTGTSAWGQVSGRERGRACGEPPANTKGTSPAPVSWAVAAPPTRAASFDDAFCLGDSLSPLGGRTLGDFSQGPFRAACALASEWRSISVVLSFSVFYYREHCCERGGLASALPVPGPACRPLFAPNLSPTTAVPPPRAARGRTLRRAHPNPVFATSTTTERWFQVSVSAPCSETSPYAFELVLRSDVTEQAAGGG